MSAETEHNDWDWRTLCQDFMIDIHVPVLERVKEEQYGDEVKQFITEYLEPVLALLRDVKQSAEDYFSTGEKSEDAWVPYYEKFVQTVIHINKMNTELHKGDFYIHLSSVIPGQMIIKYYDSGGTQSLPIDKADLRNIWAKDWTDRLRIEMNGRFLFLNCVVTLKNGKEERRPWRYLMSATRNVSYKQYRAIEKDDSLEANCRVSRQSLFLEKPLNIFDINFELLHTGVASLTGSKDKRGGHILLIDASRPDWNNVKYSSIELARILMYFNTILKKDSQKLGFSAILDARKSGVKRRAIEDITEALICFQESCPGALHIVYIVARKDSPLLMFSTTKIKEQLNFEFKLITTVQDLKKYFDADQLTPEFNGTFHYDHDDWIRFRIKLEPFMTGCRSAAKLAMGVMHQFTNTKLGDSVPECKILLEQHQQKVKEVFEDSRLSALQVEGEQILIRLHEEQNNAPKTEDYKDTVKCVENLYHQMNEVFCKLEMLTDNRTKKLEQCLQLREFEESTDKVLSWIRTEGESFLSKHTELGDSIGHVTSLKEDFDAFETVAKSYCDQTENLLAEGRSLYEGGHYEGVGLKERCRVLEEVCKRFVRSLEMRKQVLASCMEFHTLVEEASEWAISTLRQMALMNMEEILSLEGVAALRGKLQSYLADSPAWQDSRLHRISEIATNVGHERMIRQAEGILTRYKEVEDMLEQRQGTLARAEERLQGHPSSEISSTVTGGSDESGSTPPQDGDESDLYPESDDDIDSSLLSVEGLDLKPKRKISDDKMYSWKEVSGIQHQPLESVEEEEVLSPRVQEKLSYIVTEMIETERDYVKSLDYIVENYISQMDNPDLLPSLKGKKNILFGNIERLSDFHKGSFLRELENCKERPLQIGSCFLKWERQFYLYALYNMNKPRSDQLLSDHGNAYFRICQKELGDKLDLGSYLMKPVQRMCKYGLLLRDMIKVYGGSTRVSELKAAEEMVKFQLRHGNDLLAMDSLRACDINVKEQGRLLRQDNFIVWHAKKKTRRRVFLFEDLVLFSKAKKQAGGVDLYFYKHSLKTADIGLTESVGDSGLQFELWFRRRKIGETYILQPSSVEVKHAWLSEITKILWKQAMRNKEYGLTEASTGISVGSQPSFLVPSTRSDDISAYQPNTTTTPYHGKYLRSSRSVSPKRLSAVSTSSCATSGACLTDDEGGNSGHQSRMRPVSTIEERNTATRDIRSVKSSEDLPSKVKSTKDKEKSEKHDKQDKHEKRDKQNKSPVANDEKRPNFFRSLSGFSLRDRSHLDRDTNKDKNKHANESFGGVHIRRSLRDRDSEVANRRKSWMERITHKGHDEREKEKEKVRRRSLVETRTVSLDETVSDLSKEETKRTKKISKKPTEEPKTCSSLDTVRACRSQEDLRAYSPHGDLSAFIPHGDLRAASNLDQTNASAHNTLRDVSDELAKQQSTKL
ncbi:puratrophin-1-like isoform X3 [Nematostella vectensis]|uniref:puratrophin-1-like isoform X3 n=1 Tax=Nematostella vectensis TaxID=45351 RepID=UPI00207763E4|nr:puratrophin-1-like isoform X3 [Nematostella vectensis]